MRIASVLHDASPEPDGAPLFPAVALERDGALYRVSALARAFGPRYAALADEVDFHHAVVALRGALLCELDERLRSGDRPSSARILPGTFTWLPPCDTERAALFTCDPLAAELATSPRVPAFRVGSARALFGHEATVPLPPYAASASVECSLAAVLGDDLFRATALEADEAILGYAVLVAFSPGLAAQLGPVLVTRDEVGQLGPLGPLRTQLRVGGAPLAIGDAAVATFSPAESIAWISHQVPLAAGDVIGAGRVRGARAVAAAAAADAAYDDAACVNVACGSRFDFAIERLGRLSGRPTTGPELRAWRRSTAGR